MGTSSSTPSPRTLSWRAVEAGYRSPNVPVDRLIQEIWRAAQRDGGWGELLAARAVQRVASIVTDAPTAQEALARVSREIVSTKASTIATEVAKRAIPQAFRESDRAAAFSRALFAEASNYLVSRDLAGYVGADYRSQTPKDAMTLKDVVRGRVREIVTEAGPPRATSAASWRAYVTEALRRLTSS
jgi:hypothetical protein